MSKFNLFEILKEIGLQVFYYNIDNPKDMLLPCIIFFKESGAVYGSDFQNHIEKTKYIVELYSDIKDFEIENKIKNLFNKLGLKYEFTETYIKEESMYLTAYYIEIIEKL